MSINNHLVSAAHVVTGQHAVAAVCMGLGRLAQPEPGEQQQPLFGWYIYYYTSYSICLSIITLSAQPTS